MAGDGLLARPLRADAPVDRPGAEAGATPAISMIEPEPEALQRRQAQAADGLGQVLERVGARVAVVGGVRQLTGAAGVDHDHEGAAHGRG